MYSFRVEDPPVPASQRERFQFEPQYDNEHAAASSDTTDQYDQDVAHTSTAGMWRSEDAHHDDHDDSDVESGERTPLHSSEDERDTGRKRPHTRGRSPVRTNKPRFQCGLLAFNAVFLGVSVLLLLVVLNAHVLPFVQLNNHYLRSTCTIEDKSMDIESSLLSISYRAIVKATYKDKQGVVQLATAYNAVNGHYSWSESTVADFLDQFERREIVVCWVNPDNKFSVALSSPQNTPPYAYLMIVLFSALILLSFTGALQQLVFFCRRSTVKSI